MEQTPTTGGIKPPAPAAGPTPACYHGYSTRGPAGLHRPTGRAASAAGRVPATGCASVPLEATPSPPEPFVQPATPAATPAPPVAEVHELVRQGVGPAPAPAEAVPQPDVTAADQPAETTEARLLRDLVASLERHLESQKDELEARRREVQELHVLLQQFHSRALPNVGGGQEEEAPRRRRRCRDRRPQRRRPRPPGGSPCCADDRTARHPRWNA